MNLKTGDILCFKGKGFISWIVRKLMFLQKGDVFPFNHIAIAYSQSLIASAEPKGFITITIEKAFRKLHRVVVFRMKRITPEIMQKFQVEIEKRLNISYDYWMYVLHALRINLFFIPLEIYLSTLGGWKAVLSTILVIVTVYWPVRNYLMKKERATFACSEVSSEILTEIGILKNIGDPTNITPQDVFNLLANSDRFDIIYDGDGNGGEVFYEKD